MINSDRVTNARKKINKLNDKYKKGYLYKVWALRIALVVIICFGIFGLVNLFNKESLVFDENNIANLNSNKFSKEISVLYEREGEEKKFIEFMNGLENSVAIYLINNTTSKNNSFEKLAKDAEKKLNSDDWSIFKIDKNLYYNGKYIVDDKGNLSFKFDKKIEPNWAKNADKFVVLN